MTTEEPPMTTEEPPMTTEEPSCTRCRRWGPWSSWSDCDEPCGGCGRITRTRTCIRGCPGLEKTASRRCRGRSNRVPCGSDEYDYGERETDEDGCCEGFSLNRRGTYCRRNRNRN